MIRNMLVSIISLPVLFYGTIFSLEPCNKIIAMIFRVNVSLPFYSLILLILFDFYIIGLLFIKSTGKKTKDFLSIGVSAIVLFLIVIIGGMSPPGEPDFIEKFLVAGFYLVSSFSPSLFLWLGMISRKKNRVILKEASAKRKIPQTDAIDGRKDENPPPVPTV